MTPKVKLPPATAVNMQRVGHLLHARKLMSESELVQALNGDLSAFAVRQVLQQLQARKLLWRRTRGYILCPAWRAHIDSLPPPLTPARKPLAFRPLAPRNIPSLCAPRADAPAPRAVFFLNASKPSWMWDSPE